LKRQKIVEAAAAVFRRRGYAEATLNEIAGEAGTHAGSLYYYFDGRDELVAEVLSYSTIRLHAVAKEALEGLPPTADALDRFITLVRTHVCVVAERDDFSVAYQKVHDQVSDELREKVAKHPRIFAKLWDKALTDLAVEGFLRNDFDARLLRLLLIGSITWMGDWYRPTGASTPMEIADTLLRMFLEGGAADRQVVRRRIEALQPVASIETIMRPDEKKRTRKRPKYVPKDD